MPPVEERQPIASEDDLRWEAAAPELPPFPRTRPVAPPAPAVHYAGFWVRTVALAIDVVVLAIFTGPLVLAGLAGLQAGMLALGEPAPPLFDESLVALLSPAFSTMAIVYFTILHGGDGRTIGKAAVGIRVRSSDLREIGLARSLVRTLGYVVSSFLFGLGFLFAALTPRKRAWHDYLAGTCVVRLSPEEA
jgi:uncharacterized RDD family membrane protein YckC